MMNYFVENPDLAKKEMEAIKSAYEKLDGEEKEYINNLIKILTGFIRNMGRDSALELIGKIGICFCKNQGIKKE